MSPIIEASVHLTSTTAVVVVTVIITDDFSGTGSAIERVSVCLRLRKIIF